MTEYIEQTTAETSQEPNQAMSKAEAREIIRVFADTLHLYVYDRGRVPPPEALFRTLDDTEKMRRACLKGIAALTRSIKSTKRAKKASIAKKKIGAETAGNAEGSAA